MPGDHRSGARRAAHEFRPRHAAGPLPAGGRNHAGPVRARGARLRRRRARTRSGSTTTCRGCGSCRRRRSSRTAARRAACRSPVSSTRSKTISTASSAPGPKTSGWRRTAAASAPTGAACAPSARRSRAAARPRESFPSCASWIRSRWRFRRARCAADRRPCISTCFTRRSRSSSRSANPRATSIARASTCTTASASPTNSCRRCATTCRSRCAVPKDGKVLRTRQRARTCGRRFSRRGCRPASPTCCSATRPTTSWRRTSASSGLKVRQSNLCSEILLPTGRGSPGQARAPRCAACRR